MMPLEASMERPSGSPLADQAMVAVVDESEAVFATGSMGEPERSDWLPGLATLTVSVTVHEKEDVLE
jgi:hypothetical protein